MKKPSKATTTTATALVENAGGEIDAGHAAPAELLPPTDAGEADALAKADEPGLIRTGTKSAALLALLQRDEGASLDEMVERTGWQSHTVRAAMTGLRKKGHTIDRRVSGNSTVWFIAAGAAS